MLKYTKPDNPASNTEMRRLRRHARIFGFRIIKDRTRENNYSLARADVSHLTWTETNKLISTYWQIRWERLHPRPAPPVRTPETVLIPDSVARTLEPAAPGQHTPSMSAAPRVSRI